MSAREAVALAPAFAGGRLLGFNRILLAAVRAGSLDRIELVLDERLASSEDLLLRVLNARGDPLGLPAPHRGVLRTAEERALWSAALLDVMPDTKAGPAAVERFLPPVGAGLTEAALAVWSALLPGLRVRVAAPDEAAVPASATPGPAIVWLGAHQRKALDELGVSASELAGVGAEAAARYRPSLQGELKEALEQLEQAVARPLAELRILAHEVDPSLLGAWSRMERSVRRGVGDFSGAAERCLDNHSAIRRTRWRAVAQALRPADESQERGLSLLTAAALFGWEPGRWQVYLERTREFTSSHACAAGLPLFLDC